MIDSNYYFQTLSIEELEEAPESFIDYLKPLLLSDDEKLLYVKGLNGEYILLGQADELDNVYKYAYSQIHKITLSTPNEKRGHRKIF